MRAMILVWATGGAAIFAGYLAGPDDDTTTPPTTARPPRLTTAALAEALVPGTVPSMVGPPVIDNVLRAPRVAGHPMVIQPPDLDRGIQLEARTWVRALWLDLPGPAVAAPT